MIRIVGEMVTEFELFFEVVISACTLYAAIGVGFSLVLHSVGIHRLDPRTRGTSLSFRLLITPALVIWWPMFAIRWIIGVTPPPVERNAHRLAAAIYHRNKAFEKDSKP